MFNQDLQAQIDYLERILSKSAVTSEILKKAPGLQLPNWYLGAGAIAQTVWNELHGYPLDHGIKDYDLVYFDPNTTARAQDAYVQKGKEAFAALPIQVEVTNEARVHLWYKNDFGKPRTPSTPGRRRRPLWASGIKTESSKCTPLTVFTTC